MKMILFLGSVLLVLLVPLTGIAQTTAPTISDFQISGIENVKPGAPCVISYNFNSNQRPDEVIVDSTIIGRGFSRRAVYTSKKNELQVTITEKDGVFEIAASRNAVAPPSAAGGSPWEVEVWIKSGGNDSNKLKITKTIGS
jgi:hypothetical protein